MCEVIPSVMAFPENRTTRSDGDSREGRRALLLIATQIWCGSWVVSPWNRRAERRHTTAFGEIFATTASEWCSLTRASARAYTPLAARRRRPCRQSRRSPPLGIPLAATSRDRTRGCIAAIWRICEVVVRDSMFSTCRYFRIYTDVMISGRIAWVRYIKSFNPTARRRNRSHHFTASCCSLARSAPTAVETSGECGGIHQRAEATKAVSTPVAHSAAGLAGRQWYRTQRYPTGRLARRKRGGSSD